MVSSAIKLELSKWLKKIWCNLEKSCDWPISNSLGFVSGSWILLSLIDFHLSARVDDFLVQDLSSFFEIFNWSRCVAFLRFLDFQRTLRNFVMKSWGTYSIKYFLFYLAFFKNSTLKAQKDEKDFFWGFKHDDKGTLLY